MGDVHLEAVAGFGVFGVGDQRAVAGAEHLDVGQFEQASEGGHVGVDVADDCGGVAEDRVAGEEDALFFDVVAERVDGVSGAGHDLDSDAAVEVDGVAVGVCLDALVVFRQLTLEQLDAVLGYRNLRLQMLAHVLEVAGVVEVVMGNGGDADLGVVDGCEVAAQHPAELVDRLAGVDGQGLTAALTDDVDVGRGGAHRLVLGDGDHADVVADFHVAPL